MGGRDREGPGSRRVGNPMLVPIQFAERRCKSKSQYCSFAATQTQCACRSRRRRRTSSRPRTHLDTLDVNDAADFVRAQRRVWARGGCGGWRHVRGEPGVDGAQFAEFSLSVLLSAVGLVYAASVGQGRLWEVKLWEGEKDFVGV